MSDNHTTKPMKAPTTRVGRRRHRGMAGAAFAGTFLLAACGGAAPVGPSATARADTEAASMPTDTTTAPGTATATKVRPANQAAATEAGSGPGAVRALVGEPPVKTAGESVSLGPGQFTAGPQGLPGNKANSGDGGCSSACIQSAVLTQGSAPGEMELAVHSHTAARFTVWVGTNAPLYANGIPHFGDLPALADSGAAYRTDWDVTLGGLTPGVQYHIILRALDEGGRRDDRVGAFQTAALPPEIAGEGEADTWIELRFERLVVNADGDPGAGDEGELSFTWGTIDEVIGEVGVQEMTAGDELSLGGVDSVVRTEVEGFMPTLYVVGMESDRRGGGAWCRTTPPLTPDPGRALDCNLRWNVASSGLVLAEQTDGLPTCSAFGLVDLGDVRCMLLESPDDLGGEYPRFQALVSVNLMSWR